MKRMMMACVVALTAACSGEGIVREETPKKVEQVSSNVGEERIRSEYEKWQAERLAKLKAEGGWLSLAGLFWLDEGQNWVGSASDNDVILPASAPARVGAIVKQGGKAFFEPSPNGIATIDGKPAQRMEMKPDLTGEPTIVNIGSVNFQVIERAGRFGVRIKDANAPTRTNFRGLEYYPYDPALRVEARFVPYDPPRQIPIVNVVNLPEPMQSPGALLFTIGSNEYRLDPVLEEGSDDWFIIFGDATNGKETYGAGRYVYAAPPDASGKTIIDFNRAYNPPCAFTPFATCPLPPRQNKLTVAIEAGEKTYRGDH